MNTQYITSEDLQILLQSPIREVEECDYHKINFSLSITFDAFQLIIKHINKKQYSIGRNRADYYYFEFELADDDMYYDTTLDTIYSSDDRFPIANELFAKCLAFYKQKKDEVHQEANKCFRKGIDSLRVECVNRGLKYIDQIRKTE